MIGGLFEEIIMTYAIGFNEVAHENRPFSMVSKIMKTKHGTAMSSVNNIR